MKYSLFKSRSAFPTSHWDNYLGCKWDILPGKDDQASDFVVRQMKFTEVNNYTYQEIRISIQGVHGYFKHVPEYRQVIIENANAYSFQATLEDMLPDQEEKKILKQDEEEDDEDICELFDE